MNEAIDFSNFGTDLMRTVQDMGGNIVLINSTLDGVASLQNDFSTEIIRDKGLLVSAEIKDAFKAASDKFEGQNALEIRSRKADFTEGDIDLEITLDQIKKAYRSYYGWMLEPTRTESEVRDNPFELFFIRQIIRQHFQFARTKTVWKGVYNTTAKGAENIADGFLKKFTAARASTDAAAKISANHVFDGEDLTDDNAYEQINGLAQLVASTREDMLAIPLNFYLSQVSYDKYRRNRRALFPEHVGPADKPTTLDDYSQISFVIDPGLAGKQTMAITPKDNLKFIANEAPGVYHINIVKQVKSWQISIRVSIGFDFASPDLLFINDAV
ncbi:hypothetical protein [Spirosoma oryzicola]|uniref:hypothetical protein n=1 Tax=Spirosoma oryzicola TaxID=2898794 RepID=UPI001E42DA9F|nr:hypothetical protein [Spirosoma oryzicola]UHG90126.1 hypothetical protein LQ777_17960 [Spirosoma oryzicola]